MIKNNLIKSMSLTTLVVSLIVSNPYYANAEISINDKEIREEIANSINNNNLYSILTLDNLKFEQETTIEKSFNYEDKKINLANEVLYEYKCDINVHTCFYYGLTSKSIYMKTRGQGAGDLVVVKDQNIYGYFDFLSYQYRENETTYGWIGYNGWSKNFNDNWYYFKDGIVEIGWIYDNGNWYYCYGNGKMAYDTIIDGYHLNLSGAWDY